MIEIMLVDPVLPLSVPMGWAVVQDDQHRRPIARTAGISGNTPLLTEWLNILTTVIIFVAKTFSRIVQSPILPSPIMDWIRERFVVHEGRRRFAFYTLLPETS